MEKYVHHIIILLDFIQAVFRDHINVQDNTFLTRLVER